MHMINFFVRETKIFGIRGKNSWVQIDSNLPKTTRHGFGC